MLKRIEDYLPSPSGEEATAAGVQPLPAMRVERAKRGFSARLVPDADLRTLLTGERRPRAGDLVLARVEKLGQHRNLDTLSGRRHLFPGDEIVVCYGNRYAPDQFEAEVPADLAPCELVAAGGLAARQQTRHDRMRTPTSLRPLGLLGNALGQPLNLASYALPAVANLPSTPPAFAIAGTAMNAGKTTTAAFLIRGLSEAGYRVAALKLTGTGSPNDIGYFQDAGAEIVLDFTDAGHASTYRATLGELEQIYTTLMAAASAADVIVIEIADGLLQTESAALLRSPLFQSRIDGLLFAAGDAMGAVAGVEWLQRNGLHVLGISGLLTRAPLAMREASEATGVPVYTKEMLAECAVSFVSLARPHLKYG